ncbi:hypothetical protein LV779_24890 [Streptomyces thinghirensis]|nr:hypothetical protein [Streptomyces thinghirensis]
MWAFPYLTLATIAFIAGVLVLMAVLPGHRLELWLSLGLAAVLVGVGTLRQRRLGAQPPAESRAGAETPSTSSPTDAVRG